MSEHDMQLRPCVALPADVRPSLALSNCLQRTLSVPDAADPLVNLLSISHHEHSRLVHELSHLVAHD